jgi:hypothetical protein
VKKLRTKTAAAQFDPREHEWDGENLDQLHGWEDEIAGEADPTIAYRLFGNDARAAFEAGWILGYTFPPDWSSAANTDGAQAEPSSWGPIPLYGKDVPARRIYFLELIAWAIHHVESFHTREEATDFGKHLTETRKAVWGEGKPWRGAAHSGMAFLDHVRAMADVFAHAPSAEEALYPNREHQPLA